MRFFFTDDFPGLPEALREAGHEVVSDPGAWARGFIRDPGFHPSHYPLDRLVLGRQPRPEVVVLVNPLRVVPTPDGRAQFGFARGHARALRNAGVTLVMAALDGGETLRRFAEGDVHWSCACRQNDVAVHLVASGEEGDLIRGSHRAALWAPGLPVDKLVAAVLHARSGKTYSPKAQAREWA